MTYANMDGVPTQTAGTSELLASDWNTYVRDNFDSIKFGHIVCTSSTRPTGIAEGTMIYETDTNKTLTYNGSAWIEVNDLDYSPGYTICTSSTRPSSNLFEGQMIYETDTNKVLVYTGSAWKEISDLDSADGLSASGQTKLDDTGLVLLDTKSPSAATATSVDNVFSSSYRNYKIVIHGEASTTQRTQIRLRVSGTDAITNYTTQRVVGSSTTVSADRNAVSSDAWADLGFAGNNVACEITLCGVNLAANTTGYSVSGGGGSVNIFCGLLHGTATAYTSFTHFANTGTFTGKIYTYGIRGT